MLVCIHHQYSYIIMQTHYLLIFFVIFQGGGCIKYFLQCSNMACVLDFSSETPNQVDSKSCITIDRKSKVDFTYEITQEAVHDIENGPYSTYTLKRSPFNATAETINIYRYDTDILVRDFTVDWIHNKIYILLYNIVSASLTKSDQLVPLDDVITNGDLASFTGAPTQWLDIQTMKIDPYRGYMFTNVWISNNTFQEFIVVRLDLSGNKLEKVLVTPILQNHYRFYLDISEMKMYVSLDKTMNIYNYEGKLLRTLPIPFSPMEFVVFNDNMYLTTYPHPSRTSTFTSSEGSMIHELALHQSASQLETRNVYYLNTSEECTVRVLDARIQRRREGGKYVCDRTDCPERCLVESSGDNCVCFHSKAKAKDGVMCYNCGQSNLTSLLQQTTIVNGKVSYPSNFPWQAIIYKTTNRNQICGGTLVSSQVILTAAHCVTVTCVACSPSVMKPEDLMVALGKVNWLWNITEPHEVRRNVSKVMVRDGYMGVSTSYANDIALLILDVKVPSNPYVMPACLDYNLNQLPSYSTLTGYVSGFGYTRDCGGLCSNYSNTLLYTNGTVMNVDDCLEALNTKLIATYQRLSADKFCMGNGTESAVQTGDSGGGFTSVFHGLHFVTGVVSAKLIKYKNLTSLYSFGAFTNVSMHMDWLKQNVIE